MYIQDWLTFKVVKSKDILSYKLKTGDKIVYEANGQKFIGTYIGYKCQEDIRGKFLYKLTDKNLQRFHELDKKAKKLFSSIKDDLSFIFPMLKFITAKMNFSGNILYIYFYGGIRIDFREWLGDLRKLIGMKFFLYQVGARDRIRLHPNAKDMVGDCGNNLCCIKTLCRLRSIETKTIHFQNLQTQGIDKQKGICGKLKCCLKFEEKNYVSALKDYPTVGTNIEIDGKNYTIIGVNVLSEYVFIKDSSGYIGRISKKELSNILNSN